MNIVRIIDGTAGETREQKTRESMSNVDFMYDMVYPFVVHYVGIKVLCNEDICFTLEYEDQYGNRQSIDFANLSEVQKWYQE